MLDTGASITFIDRRLASRFKALTLSELPGAYQADFASVSSVSSQLGSEQLGFVEPQPISVGSVTIDDSDLWATVDFDLFSQSLGSRIDGILGIDTIRRFNWVFERDRHQLTALLTAPSAATFERCIGYEDSYNRSPAVYLTHGESSVRMYLDTGADQSYADHAFIDFMVSQKAISGEDAMPRKGVDASGMVEGREHILTGLHFDERQLGELRVSENSNEQYGLGLDFVNRFNRFAIMPGRMMICYDADSLARKVPPTLRNIGVRFDGEHLQVYYSDERDLAPMVWPTATFWNRSTGWLIVPSISTRCVNCSAPASRGRSSCGLCGKENRWISPSSEGGAARRAAPMSLSPWSDFPCR